MKKKSYLMAVAAAMVLALPGCGGFSALEDSDFLTVLKNDAKNEDQLVMEDTQEDISSEKEAQDPEEQEQKLYNKYIEINNYMVGRIYDSLSRYFSYVDSQEEFKLLDESRDYFDCYSISESTIELVEETHEIAEAKSEKDALDQAFLNLYPSLKSVMEILNNIEVYTDMKSFLDDDYGKAKEYHTALMGAYTEYSATGETFFNELETVADKRQEETLARMKEEGQEVLYAVNMVMNLASDIEEELVSQGVWDENILEMDMEKIQPLYDEFVSYVEKVAEYNDDKEKLAAEGVSSSGLDSFVMDMKDAKVSLTEVMQKVKNGEELSFSDLLITDIAGQCSLSSFDEGVSAMISDYNNWFASY
ncbi:MAG: YiiG family protein [Roseburia sp.]|nr:YiiG family protein [Roseburia sp.]